MPQVSGTGDWTFLTSGTITSNRLSTAMTTTATAATTTASTLSLWANVYRAPVTVHQSTYHYGANRIYDDGGQARSNRNREAKDRACRLLRERLTRDQRASFDRDKSFELVGRSGKKYRLRCRRVGNIEQLADDGKVAVVYCVHPADFVPDEDTLLAQKLWLEAADEELLAKANVHYRSMFAA